MLGACWETAAEHPCEGTQSPLSFQRSERSRKVSANPNSNVRASAFLAQSGVGEREEEWKNKRKLLNSLVLVFYGTRGPDYKISVCISAEAAAAAALSEKASER